MHDGIEELGDSGGNKDLRLSVLAAASLATRLSASHFEGCGFEKRGLV